MDMNLYELIKDRKKLVLFFDPFFNQLITPSNQYRLLPEPTVRVYMFQLLKALRHLHKYGVFHRDIKPENILIKLKVGLFLLKKTTS